jgi:hypothetical protein
MASSLNAGIPVMRPAGAYGGAATGMAIGLPPHVMVEARANWEREEAVRLDDRRELLRAFATHVRGCPTRI